jgi:hypothetical protein
MKDRIVVRDFTALAEPSDSVVWIYFADVEGSVHVYRDGTVVLSSPVGSTVTRLQHVGDRLWRKAPLIPLSENPSESVTRLPHVGDRLWRKETFVAMLAQMGAPDDELVKAEQMIEAREEELSQLGFRAAVEQVAGESVAHFKEWCARHDLNCEAMGDEEIDEWLAAQLAQVRGTR